MSVDRITFLQQDPEPSSSKSLQIIEEVAAALGAKTKVGFGTFHTPYDVGSPETTTSTVDYYKKQWGLFYRRVLRLCGEQQWSHGRDTVQEVYSDSPNATPTIVQRKRNPIPSEFSGYIAFTNLPADIRQILDTYQLQKRDKRFYI